MFGSIGLPELVLLVPMMVMGLLPLIIAVWALVTLQRIRTEQQTMQMKLDAIARQLSRP
jgi:predicted membrane-bound spermidine synthase